MNEEYGISKTSKTRRTLSCPECGKQIVIVAPVRGAADAVIIACMGYDGCDHVWSQPITSLFRSAVEAKRISGAGIISAVMQDESRVA
jgi:ssDNA-binding Zn-finger/Zn-ribbon topoisomerase 1